MEAVLQTDYLMDILHTAEKNYCFNMFVSNWHHYEKWLPWDSPNNHIFFFSHFHHQSNCNFNLKGGLLLKVCLSSDRQICLFSFLVRVWSEASLCAYFRLCTNYSLALTCKFLDILLVNPLHSPIFVLGNNIFNFRLNKWNMTYWLMRFRGHQQILLRLYKVRLVVSSCFQSWQITCFNHHSILTVRC